MSVLSFSAISSNLDKRIITLGDVFMYRIIIPESLIISATPIIIDNIENQVDVVLISGNSARNKSEYIQIYNLSSYRLGDLQIPTMQVLIGESTYTVSANSIKVISAFESGVTKNLITSFKAQGKIPFKWWSYVFLLLFCGIIALGVIYIIGKIKNKEAIGLFKHIEPLDPYLEAIRKLDQINDSGLLEQNMKQFYFEISAIVKQYLSLRLNTQLLESTTFEIKLILPSILEKKIAEDYYRFLIDLDPVKYAKHQPSINESKGKINYAKQILENTEKYLSQEEDDVV